MRTTEILVDKPMAKLVESGTEKVTMTDYMRSCYTHRVKRNMYICKYNLYNVVVLARMLIHPRYQSKCALRDSAL